VKRYINDKKKVRATGTGCEWKIYASFVPDSKIFMAKTLNLILIPWQLLFFHISCTFYTWTFSTSKMLQVYRLLLGFDEYESMYSTLCAINFRLLLIVKEFGLLLAMNEMDFVLTVRVEDFGC